MKPYKRYNSYKESGVPWIEKIPSYWRYSRLKFHLSESSGGIWGQDDEVGNGTYVLRSTEITINGHWNLQNLTKRKLSKEEAERFLLKKGDLIITKSSGSQDHIGKTGLVDEKIEAMVVCYSNFVQKLRPQSHINSRFLHYFMNCPLAREQYKYQSETTTGLANLNAQSINELFISVPPKQEQIQIANFLDRKTAEIDRFIANEEKLISQLNDQKAIIVDHAVTKGLDPNVEMKPSGVEWIGDICKHWEIKKLKHIVQGGLTNGLFKKKDQFGSGIKLINVTDIYQEDFLVKFEELDRVEAEPHEIETYAVEPGDIFFVRSSLKLEGVAASACIANVPEPTVFECHLVRLRPCPIQVLFKYLISYLNSTQTRQRLITLANTVTMTTIAQPKLASIEVILPPLSEQRIIVDFLDRETKQIDRLISKERQKIELIKQYRQVLISQAVTGKIDVRGTV